MKIINVHQAKTHLSRYLAAIEKEKSQFVVARGARPVARLVPYGEEGRRNRRPKVGEIEGRRFQFPEEAFRPLSRRELKEWGL